VVGVGVVGGGVAGMAIAGTGMVTPTIVVVITATAIPTITIAHASAFGSASKNYVSVQPRALASGERLFLVLFSILASPSWGIALGLVRPGPTSLHPQQRAGPPIATVIPSWTLCTPPSKNLPLRATRMSSAIALDVARLG
jgi:hypothetical protein